MALCSPLVVTFDRNHRPFAMIVCVCRRVSDRDIHRHAQQGVGSFDDLQMESGISTCCGRCESCARQVFEQACAAQQVNIPLIRHMSDPAAQAQIKA